MKKYKVNHSTVAQIIEDVKRNNIAIPELQRPFVWKSTKVRDLLDSLYKGYPVGYLITWQSVGAHIKGGETAKHQHILIDGQQRVTALRAAIAGLQVINARYQKTRISIAFNPLTEQFETTTAIIRKNPAWIADISDFFNATSNFSFINDYINNNPDIPSKIIEENFEKLSAIKNAQIGVIELADDLDVETVSEIFIRINSQGVRLSSADFVMSKIASYGDKGRELRKIIDYFSHLSTAPNAYDDIVENDKEFAETDYFRKISWLKNDSDSLYVPSYENLVRVAGLVGFGRGKAASIVNELSGRDPETRKVDLDRIPVAYEKLETALIRIVNQYDFENFIMTIKSAGYIVPKMISSINALNFAYALYLKLREDKSYTDGERKQIVRRWFVMSLLTGRSSTSFESVWEQDLKRINSVGALNYLKQIEESELADSFWAVTLPNALQTTSSASPYFQAFLAAQVSFNIKGFLSKRIEISHMLQNSGDIHHLFPKAYLQKNGFQQSAYNEVANYALTESGINKDISDKAPIEYMAEIAQQLATSKLKIGEITDTKELANNLQDNAIPDNFSAMTFDDYQDFLKQRRKLMADIIRKYYENL